MVTPWGSEVDQVPGSSRTPVGASMALVSIQTVHEYQIKATLLLPLSLKLEAQVLAQPQIIASVLMQLPRDNHEVW